MHWQEKYEVGERLLYNGQPVVVTREACFGADDYSEYSELFDILLEVSPVGDPLKFVEVPAHHRLLVSRNFDEYNPLG